MTKRTLILFTVGAVALPAFAGLFGPKGDSVKEEQAGVRKQRDEILAKLYAEHPEAKDKVKKVASCVAFDDVKAKDLARRWFKAQHARLDLLEKYHRKIEKALSSVQAGQFLQIENQIGIFMDMTIAAEMHLVGS